MIVVDLDGTLVTRNTFRIFAGYLRRRVMTRHRYADAARYGILGILRKLHIISHHRLKWNLMQIADRTLSADDYETLADGIMQFVNQRVSDYIAGKPWILATAASEEYVIPLARRLDCHAVVATVRPASRRYRDYTEARGSEKLCRVKALLDGQSIDTALSDHTDDLPLLSAAHTPILVNPRPDTLADPAVRALDPAVWQD